MMKKSKYNIFFEYKGKKLAFNAITSCLAEIDANFDKVFSNIDSLDVKQVDDTTRVLIEDMKKGFFILDDGLSELNLLKFNSGKGKFSNRGLGLTIAPTLSCNFACPYCYEGVQGDFGFIEDDVIVAIYERVERAAKEKEPISITWYGGEPLLAKDVIWQMSERMIEICKKYEAPYSAYMVSNGYLVDDETIENLKKAAISGIQITVDGLPEVHNAHRKLKNSSKPTFDVIIKNIKSLEDAGIHVGIRINIDKTNLEGLEKLLDIFIANDLRRCDISLGHVKDYTDVCPSIAGTCLDTKEYAQESQKYQNILIEKGFSASGYPYYPGTKANYCCADSLASCVVDPKGGLYKCWNDIGNPARVVGNIKETENPEISNLFLEYLLWSPFDKQECVDCEILPICMGGCPYKGLKDEKPDCEKWKYNLVDALKTRYDVFCSEGECSGEQAKTELKSS